MHDVKAASPVVTLRRAVQSDSEFLYSWANEEAVIKGSFMRSVPVTFEQHAKWFQAKLGDPTCFLFIIEDDGHRPVGQIRFDLLEGNPCEVFVAIGIAPAARKRGYATEAIRAGTDLMFSTTDVQVIHACIKPFNTGSKKAFDGAGYEDKGITKYEGVEALYVVKRKEII